MATMSPYQLAEAECANFVNGKCIIPGTPCKLTGGLQRCGYFEECIVPLRTRTAHPDHAKYLEAIDNYIDTRNVPGRTATTRKCVCGKPLAPRQRRCSDCGKRLEKQRTRDRVKTHRLKKVGM